jgi:Putative Actinobacterial Holin-X, holin superfamily III
MSSDYDPEPLDEVRAPISALLGQLADDTSQFARAEVAYFKAEIGERANLAIPGLWMIGVGASLAAGVLIALLVGLVLWLAPLVGAGLATLAICTLGAAIAFGFFRIGTKRLRQAIKSKEQP